MESEECGSEVRVAWATCTPSLWQRGVKRGQTPSAVNHQLWFMSGHTQTISSASPLDSSKGNRGLLCLYMLELEEAVMLNRRWVVCGSQWSNAIAEFLLFADIWVLVFSCSVTFYIWFVLGWCFNQWFVDRSLMKTWQDFSGNVSFFPFPPRMLMAEGWGVCIKQWYETRHVDSINIFHMQKCSGVIKDSSANVRKKTKKKKSNVVPAYQELHENLKGYYF